MDRARIGPKAESRPMSRFRGGVTGAFKVARILERNFPASCV